MQRNALQRARLAALTLCTVCLLLAAGRVTRAEKGVSMFCGPDGLYSALPMGQDTPLLPQNFRRAAMLAVGEGRIGQAGYTTEDPLSPLAGAWVYEDASGFNHWLRLLYDKKAACYVPYLNFYSAYAYNGATVYGDGRQPAVLWNERLYWLTDRRVKKPPAGAVPVGVLTGVTEDYREMPTEERMGRCLNAAYCGGALYLAADGGALYLEDTLHPGYALFAPAEGEEQLPRSAGQLLADCVQAIEAGDLDALQHLMPGAGEGEVQRAANAPNHTKQVKVVEAGGGGPDGRQAWARLELCYGTWSDGRMWRLGGRWFIAGLERE